MQELPRNLWLKIMQQLYQMQENISGCNETLTLGVHKIIKKRSKSFTHGNSKDGKNSLSSTALQDQKIMARVGTCKGMEQVKINRASSYCSFHLDFWIAND